VLQNLIENAIKYNQINGSVTISGEVFNETLVISITDTGIGIPMSDQKNIFSKFYRASNTSKEKGTGLGLFVAKQIIEGHHGTLRFESVPNVGTTFLFSLPLVPSSGLRPPSP
jgi:signal transduction histidine kinase